jgi:hypothetical protein
MPALTGGHFSFLDPAKPAPDKSLRHFYGSLARIYSVFTRRNLV